MKKDYQTPKLKIHGDVAKLTNHGHRDNNFIPELSSRCCPPCGS